MKLAVSLFLLSASAVWANQFDANPRSGIYVLHEEETTAGYPETRIISDFPVSSLRHGNFDTGLYPNGFFDPSRLVLVVNSNCPASLASITVSDSNEGDAGRVIRISTSVASSFYDQTSFMEPSSFSTEWEHNSSSTCDDRRRLEGKAEQQSWTSGRVSWNENRDYAGYEEPAPTLRGGGGGAIPSRPAGREPAGVGSVTRPPGRVGSVTRPPGRGPTTVTQPPVPPGGCKVNVDVYTAVGCTDFIEKGPPIKINAPIARTMNDRTSEEDQWDAATNTCHSKFNITFGYEFIHNTQNANPSLPPFELPQACTPRAAGRPFVDQGGKPITASLDPQETCVWSAAAGTESSSVAALGGAGEEASRLRESLGKEWAQKALGEHSSVASFAALVIALMSNGAPPDLIQDSLTAAQDEVRHALVSFEVASLFLEKQPVEPGALPPTSHQFGQNLTALALATANEGCVHETLSAITMAVEVDKQLDQLAWLEPKEKAWLKEKMTRIAMDEAKHSALAWRTIRWVCEVDKVACDAVNSTVLEPSRLQSVAKQRLRKDHAKLLPFADLIETTWHDLYNLLAPLATGTVGAQDCGLDWRDHRPTSLAMSVFYSLMQDFCGYPASTKEEAPTHESYQVVA